MAKLIMLKGISLSRENRENKNFNIVSFSLFISSIQLVNLLKKNMC